MTALVLGEREAMRRPRWRGADTGAKRVFDVTVGSVLAVVAVPLIVVLALAVCLSLRTCRPVFLQQRVGRWGRLFTVPKLRTLPLAAPSSADKYAIASVGTTRFCRFLRSTHLDELPQLFLVPTGRMSLVGPRPEMPWLLDTFDPDFVARRTSVRPGCSGLWQVSADCDKLIGEVPEYDLYYISHADVRLDIWILWQTVRTTLGRRPTAPGPAIPGWASCGAGSPTKC